MKKFKNKLFFINSFFLYIILIFIFSILALVFLEARVNSLLIRAFAQRSNSDIYEVVIDDYSTQHYNLPWTMDKYADLLDFFFQYSNPKVVGFDAIMSTYTFDEHNPADLRFLKQVSKMDNLVFGFVPETVNGDEDKEILKVFKKKYSINTEEKEDTFTSYYNGVIDPSQIFLNAAKNYGSVSIQLDPSAKKIYSSSNIIKIKDDFYPSLPLKMYLVKNLTNDIVIDDEFVTIPKTGLKIPYSLNPDLGTLDTDIRYYKVSSSGYSHRSISASRILDTYYALKSGITPENHPELYDLNNGGKYTNPEIFNNKSIIIGQNISGPSSDVLISPMNDRHPGVDIQATVYQNMVGDTFYHRAIGISFLAFLLFPLLTFIIIIRSRFIRGLLYLFLMDSVFILYVCLAAARGTIVPYVVVTIVCQIVTVVFGHSFKFITENRNKEKIKQAMGKYLSQDIMKNVVNNIDDLKLGGKRAIVTVLFSDIRGFTSLSEKMSAEEVSLILNEYFAEMEPIITKYNGVINKFIGDAVMAIFGEPIQDINHARNAVKCAYEMLKKVEYLREKWLFEGKPKIEIGVGINTGEVFIGNIGTETRMEYTVIGDTVNLASRIESYNKVYKTNLLVSSSTYEHISDIADVIKISEVQIRGKAKKMNIYEVLRIDNSK